MAAKKRSRSTQDQTIEVLKDLLIVQLGLAEVSQPNIRKIVGCEMRRVSRIVRHLKKQKEGQKMRK